MLGDAIVSPSVAVSDMERAKKFFGESLGLKVDSENPGGVVYKCGASRLFVYQSQYAGTNKATYAGWIVDDVPAVAEELKSKGVSLEHYPDMPGVKLEGDVHKMGDNFMAIWFTDPDGNIFSVTNEMA